jgi:hypothetical protein
VLHCVVVVEAAVVAEVESPTAELVVDQASSVRGLSLIREQRGCGCRKSVGVLTAIASEEH